MFFFSSRRRHTRWNCDWSSDVCSSDLAPARHPIERRVPLHRLPDLGNGAHDERIEQIGRASCRERVQISVVGEELKKKNLTLSDPRLTHLTKPGYWCLVHPRSVYRQCR